MSLVLILVSLRLVLGVAVRAADEAPTGSVDYLLRTGLNDFLVDRVG